MKHGKKLLSLLLALVMLCGLVQIPVSAVGTEAATELKLIGAMPITGDVLPSLNLHSNGTWGDKTLMLYFNRETSINPTGANVYGRIVIVDSNNDVVSYNGTNLIWSASRKTSSNDGPLYGINGYFMNITSSITIGSTAVDTWTEIYAFLASNNDYKLQLRVCEYGVANDTDRLIGAIYATDDNSVKLQANLQVTSGTAPTTGGTVDCAYIDICTPTETAISLSGVVTLNSATMITNQDIALNFSEPVVIRANGNTAVLEIVNAKGTASKTYSLTLPTTAYGATITASLTSVCWTNIRSDLAAAEAGSYVRFKMTEKNLVTNQGEQTSNCVVDTVWGTENDKPLRSNITATGSADYVLCNVTEDIPEVRSAVLQDANADTVKMLVTFNKPVTVNAKNNDVWLRFGSYSNGNGQLQMANKEYMNGYSIGDKTYSNQILFSFANTNKPLNGDVGILFAEYNYHNGAHEDYQVDGCVIADENGFGLLPTHVTSCSNANCTNQKVSLSYTKATLAEDAAGIVSISRVDDTKVTVKFAMNVAGIDTAKGITLGGHTVTAAEGNADTWTLTLDGTLTGADKELTIPANAVTTGYNGSVVGKAMTATLSVTDRIASAKEGETVALESDLTVDTLVVPVGVTVDLNGHVLTTATACTITNTSAIKDSTNGTGGIRIAKDQLIFAAGTNPQMPLYDDGVYRFFDCNMVHMQRAGQTADSVMFGVRMELNDLAYSLLEDPTAAGAKLSILLKSDAFAEDISYEFKTDILTEYAQNMQNKEGYWVIVLTIHGLDVLDEGTTLTATPVFTSTTTTVAQSGMEKTYTK